ncbi:hypothetical protein V6N13_022121 [Hibiscus sabdariffa]
MAIGPEYSPEYPSKKSAFKRRPRLFRKRSEAHALKVYLEYKFQPKEVSFILDSSYFLHSNSGEKSVERNTYLFDIERVKLKKRMNAVHVRNQKHELTPPRNRDKPITQQDALPRSESPPRYLPGQDPLSLFEASPLSSCLDRSSKNQNRRS